MRMSKINLAILALSGTMLVSGTTLALDCDPQFYVGAEGQVNRYSGTKKLTDRAGEVWELKNNKSWFHKSGGGFSLFAGSRINEFFGIEAGYTFLSGGKMPKLISPYNSMNTVTSPKAKHHRNMYADIMGYVPISECVDLIGSVGIGRLSTKISGKIEEFTPRGRLVEQSDNFAKSSKTGIRVGAGVGYNIDENLSARLMLRHQKGNKYVKNMTSAGLGLMYKF